ncbi:sigma-54 interaction domain-containing protein [Anoxynatronum buryatiense]|uniref:PAS domain S-box-containing protein n=1 Tax=Anoxynatronum buryatiense TaxID=489973 RepID=A0AA45WYI2_9CLOT|nr:sigma-54-dependent Fis family transcriptional regulator [Anoxynatronum buryatiense]SMP69188.1 PAS domain S-box-containing protein [Anoxynatronum buryatiense]
MDRMIETILKTTKEAVMATDRHHRIVLFNQAAEIITGWHAASVLQQSVTTVFPESRLPEVMETGVAELEQRQRLSGVEIIVNRVPVVRDGQVTGAVAVFRDVSEVADLSRQIDRLKEMQSLLEGILHSTQDAISVCDENGIHVIINPAYTRLTGLSQEEIIGKPVTVDIVDGESIHLRVLKEKKPISNARLTVGRHQKEIIASAAPIIVDGELRGSVGILQDLTEMKKLSRELMLARQIIRKLEAKYTFDDIIALDPKTRLQVEKGKQAAMTPASILLRGESGTGKELFAHAIHNLSDRRYNQFIRVNCAAINENLLESELFGYEEGAFTGARKGGKNGLFLEAHNGTIFLDEIAEIPVSTQVKLLRVLQEKEIMPVGSTRTINVDVRVIAATNANLEKAVEAGRFREDLYYRLNVIPIVIPPLRDRRKDIQPLVMSMVQKYNQEYGRSAQAVSPRVMERLLAYHWPGNVRELQNYVGRAMVNMKVTDSELEERHLPKFFDNDLAPAAVKSDIELTPAKTAVTLAEAVEATERELILATLGSYHGNRSKTASALGISIRNLYYKMEKYQIGDPVEL